MPEICARSGTFSSPPGCHIQTDPLPKISCLAAILAVEAIDLDQTGAAKPDTSPKAMRQNIDWVTIFMWVWVAGLVWLALTILWAMAPG